MRLNLPIIREIINFHIENIGGEKSERHDDLDRISSCLWKKRENYILESIVLCLV